MNRLERKDPVGIAELMRLTLKAYGMAPAHNSRLIFKAWDEASGAARYTCRRFFRAGRLYVTLNSSVVRSRLAVQKDAILLKINAILAANELYIKDMDDTGGEVRELILK